MSKQFQVTVTNPDRAALFQRVFGSATVAVQFPFPVLADLPAPEGEQLVYLLDLREISDQQRARLVEHFIAEFNLDRVFVEDRITGQGVPILARDAIMTTTANLGLWVDDAPEEYLEHWADMDGEPDGPYDGAVFEEFGYVPEDDEEEDEP